ncbi:Planctomycete cytochrome C [Gimesia panareensis]|uniref:Planctomycete cytochrome C n=1 Tax=Gimesia panareensis TaxID=2527978 RepID=A0A518FV41_9PLAN|nr:PSD1 and planctomycete cytochrome C domain-containing protein [Gimesia panareensis]QDV20216.1 Planctomycete cytochrome C [Gimesia panareensis]
MTDSRIRTTLVTLLSCLCLLAGSRFCAAEPVDFRRDVAPLLKQHCLVCHNKRIRQGELSLHSLQATLHGGESGQVVDPGDPEASYLLDLITPSEGVAEMPREAPPLSEKEQAVFRRWIKAGAPWPDKLELEPPLLWSLKPLTRPAVPTDVKSTAEFPIRNSIDAFIASRLQQAGVPPAPPADRRTLIRRLYLDLVGLLPSPEEVEAFVANTDSQAYERHVDKLLASPHFGERWGRYWLDMARYADSSGYLGDSMRPHVWVYREWVIDAINEDIPFDQFSIEQLAGDLFEKPTVNQKVATGFHRNTLKNTEAGVDLELYRTKEIVDRVNTTGMVWLGLTFGCAECHDHKHDPISQNEFYQLYSFFNNANETTVKVQRDWEEQEYQQALVGWQPDYDRCQTELKAFENADLTEKQRTEIDKILKGYKRSSDLKKLEPFYQTKKEGWDQLSARLGKLLSTQPKAPSTRAPVFAERTKDRRETFVHVRGVYNRPGDKVSPGTPSVLPDLQSRQQTPDRLDLAQWLFREENPLTPRVSVNRIWQHLFGRGIVSTPNDFGTKGATPTHPLLLDWLASEYRQRDWSRKAMIKLIVMSSAYQMSSAANARDVPQDVNNLLFWRQNSFRVEAEIVRDIHLTASGLLDRTIGRKGIRPPLPAFVTDVGRSVKWPATQGSARYRRGMYIVFKRTVPFPMLMTFDAPDATVSCSRRERSNTPLQALTLLNSPMFFECAEVLGKQMQEKYADNISAAIQEMYLRCLSRPASEPEAVALQSAWSDLLHLAEATQTDAKPQQKPAETSMVQLARIIMNLDEFVTRD